MILERGTIQDMVVTTEALESCDRLLHRVQVALFNETSPIPNSTHEIYLQMILMSWFRKHREDRFRVVPFNNADQLERHWQA